MHSCSLAVVVLFFLGFNTPAFALRCYFGDVSATVNQNQVMEAAGKDCANDISFCMLRNYSNPPSFRLGCEGDGPVTFSPVNCSNDREGDSIDNTGLHTYSCCNFDLCNTLPGLQLAVEVGSEQRAEALRPACPRSYVPWQFSLGDQTWRTNNTALPHLDFADAIENRFQANENATKVADLRGKVETVTDDLRSKWTAGVQPPTANQYIYTRDPSPPGCYRVSGFIQTGFCGPRQELRKDGEPPLYSLTGEQSFGGKYEINTCAGSKTEALAIGDDFSSSGKHLTFIECFESLTSASMDRDCSRMRGSYNVGRLARNRRRLLPDCCANYVHQTEETRKDCLCASTRPDNPVCQEICCCEDALTFLETDACRVLYEFIEINNELEEHVNRQCCSTRMMSQCKGSQGHCEDDEYDSGFLESLHSAPMCCEYCYDFYDQVCSYVGIQNGAEVFIQMKTRTNRPLLEEVCASKGCRNDYPCTFEGASSAVRASLSSFLLLLSPLALALSVLPSL